MNPHQHQWKPVAHIDACHYFAWTYACDCGATRSTKHERDVAYDPYSAIWMDPEGAEPCARCEQLMAGAKVAEPTDEIVEAVA